ncbi:unnamed protein product [Rotaria socialis]|uniref:Uncharacterized protein n=1 Tax=Rotaria socialis TaxID=392032 RepID=A0A820UH03_9BILA|nr:unnamed protein product [Rotaria socialis]CAF4481535.1 unnamed protein product [Rotaria socialis]
MSTFLPECSISPNLLTIIITTSPVPSAPSPGLIKNTLASLPDSLSEVPIVITFDNFTVALHKRSRLKKGCVTQDLADRYPAYIENVRKLFGDVACSSDDPTCSISSSLNRDVTFLVLKKRNGFAFCIKVALDYVKTPYVMIVQHDWLFIFHPPISHLLSILQTEDEVQYIAFLARMSLNYETSKCYTHRYYQHIFSQARNLRSDRPLSNDLVACLHWFDRPHLCSVETYRQIFAMPMLKRGDFIEDTFGTAYMQSMRDAPTKEAAFEKWKKWGAWMFYSGNGKKVTVGHQHGRMNLLGERQEERIKNMIKLNMQNHAALAGEENGILSETNNVIDGFSVDIEQGDFTLFFK